MDGTTGHHRKSHIQRDFQGFTAMKKGLSSKDAAKICLGFGAGRRFQMQDKERRAIWRPSRSMRLGGQSRGPFHALLPGFTSPEQTALPLPGTAVIASQRLFFSSELSGPVKGSQPRNQSRLLICTTTMVQAAATCPPQRRAFGFAHPFHVQNLPPSGECGAPETANGIKLAVGEGGSAPNGSIMFAWLSWR